MNKEAFVYGFMDEMEKNGVAFLAPLAAMAGKALAGKALLGAGARALTTRLAPKIVGAGKNIAGKAMSLGTKGGVPGKAMSVASNLGGMADIIRARNPKQPANAGNTITTP
jgi:hypothetical protein